VKKITLEGEGELRIKRKRGKVTIIRKEGFYLSPKMLNYMQIRTEGVFRPGQKDIEVVYALSGTHMKPDRLHTFASKLLLYDSNTEEAKVNVSDILSHVIDEPRKDTPELLIIVHTHPEGIPEPSEYDLEFFRSSEKAIKKEFPKMKVLYGVHAISGGDRPIGQKEPERVKLNTVKWSSITHEHEVSFYNSGGKTVEVVI